ncbi:MAG: hypothetical protein Q4B26_06705 [Eubacteriales bacterium]|nr:hypothetical protein [Eubacteriales bacterium]
MQERYSIRLIKECFENIRYCQDESLHTLLMNREPSGFNQDHKGKAFDIYVVYGITILTGPRIKSLGKRLKSVEEFEREAIIIYEDSDFSAGERAVELDRLLRAFCFLNGGNVPTEKEDAPEPKVEPIEEQKQEESRDAILEEGISKVNQFVVRMLADNRLLELERSTSDRELQQKLMEQYGIW